MAVPQVHLVLGPRIARAVASAIAAGLVRSAHDASEGGLAVAMAEMCFAGGLGLAADVGRAPASGPIAVEAALFGESPSRYLLEVEPGKLSALKKALADVPHAELGRFDESGRLAVSFGGTSLFSLDIASLKRAWQKTLDWK